MHWGKVVFSVLAAVAAGTAFAQRQSEAQQLGTSARNLEQSQQRANAQAGREWEHSFDTAENQRIAALPKLREHLAEVWQKFGMSPQNAKLVASFYKFEDTRLASTPSLKGKSDEEIAGMLQSALKDKNYQLADQLLIDYERKRLKIRPDARH